MSSHNPGASGSNQDRKGLLTIALDHAWRWYDFRYSQATLVLNFFTLAATVLTASYVSAINAGHRGTATAIALLGILLATSTYVVGVRLIGIAHLADEPLSEIQGELADSLGIETLRLVERRRSYHGVISGSGAVAKVMLPAVAIICLAAAGFAWFGH
jgi:hypothetical protein